MRKANAILFVLFCLAFTVFADHHAEKAPAPAMKPDPMLRQLDVLAGTWQCSGIAYASPMAPEHPTRGEVTMKWGLGGYWLPFTYAEKKTAENPMPVMVSGFFGYDATNKRFVNSGVDNMGGYWTSTSQGWSGDSLAFTGPWNMAGMTVNARDTFMKKSAREIVHVGELEQDGKWIKYGEETCTRK